MNWLRLMSVYYMRLKLNNCVSMLAWVGAHVSSDGEPRRAQEKEVH